jgi:hypothetical protein
MGHGCRLIFGNSGYKAIVSLDAYKITGTFNPWGVLLRRWEIDDIRVTLQ